VAIRPLKEKQKYYFLGLKKPLIAPNWNGKRGSRTAFMLPRSGLFLTLFWSGGSPSDMCGYGYLRVYLWVL